MKYSNIRERAFWVQDYLKGGEIRKHYLDIKQILENRGGMYNQEALEKLLEHAKSTSEFYHNKTQGNSLECFPIIDKSIIKENYAKILSSKYKNVSLHKMSTSGSTGTPLVMLQDSNKRNRVLAEVVYFGEKAGYTIGQKYMHTRVWTEKNNKSMLEKFKQNLIPVDISKLDDKNLEIIRQKLHKDKSIKYILGYANTFETLGKYLEKQGDKPINFNLNVIISSSEKLEKDNKERLKQVLGCNVISRYSNQENGILAQQCIESNEFHLNTASYYFEFLKLDEDTPAQAGELARIVITDLYNYAFPIIRYDTGDICTLTDRLECGWKTQVIEEIEGRKTDFVYDTKDNLISPHCISIHFWKYTELKQYQFIQNNKGDYTLKLNGAENIYNDMDIIDTVKSYIGKDARVRIEHVQEIPVLKSGKFKKIVCNYEPK